MDMHLTFFHFRVNTTPSSGKKRRLDLMENDNLLDSAER